MKNIWNKLSFLGLEEIDQKVAFLQYRDIILLNRLVGALLTVFVVYIPFEIIFNGVDLIFVIIINFLIIALTLYLNYLKKFNWARWNFLWSSIISIAPLILIAPKETNYSLFMIPVSLVPIIVFKERYKIIIGFLFVTILYFVLEVNADKVDDLIVVSDELVNLFSYFFTSMLFVILFFLVFYLKNINIEYEAVIIEKTNELEESKEIIEQHNKDITDSINYAKKIQEAYMPPVNVLNHYFPQSFLFFQPKDIVSGDFYWVYCPEVEGKKSDIIFVAVADCTGHGVPGAIMSVICCNALNEAVITKGINETGKILDEVRSIIIQNLKSKNTSDRKDGMDISLVKINRKTNDIEFSGANNPLWFLKENKFYEIKPDKQPVAMYELMKPFSTHHINLNPDFLFLFTDGFADQFGGPKGKKFKYSNFQVLLKKMSNHTTDEMQRLLSNEFHNWKGELEQVDDVSIIGIKL